VGSRTKIFAASLCVCMCLRARAPAVEEFSVHEIAVLLQEADKAPVSSGRSLGELLVYVAMYCCLYYNLYYYNYIK
jgi:hypothetical protein